MSEKRCQHLIVTGGNGYIGQRLVEMALAAGRKVTLLGRRPGPALTRHIAWTLGEAFPPEALDPALAPEQQALVHLAHDWQGGEAVNVDGTMTLFDGAAAAGLERRIFISSQSARSGALNRYGRIKFTLEQRLHGAASLRVGLVYGGPPMAMYGLLCRIADLPLLPMVDPHRCVQPIHRDEVAQGIFGAADRSLTGVFALAGPDPVPFGDVLQAFARLYGARRLRILPVPLRLALWGCDLTARLPLVPTIDRERVLGLAGTQKMDVADDLVQLGVTVKPLAHGLASEPMGRRALIDEARAFLRHAVKVAPEPRLLKRYARAFREGAIVRPRILLGWREPLGAGSPLAIRMRAAARLAETGTAAEAHLSRKKPLIGLAGVMLLEGLKFPSRLIVSLHKY